MRTLIIDSRIIRSWETSLTTECQQQLLTWLVKGAVAWQRDGLPLLPDNTKVAMQSYVADNDNLRDFLDQSCELGAGLEHIVMIHSKSNNLFQTNNLLKSCKTRDCIKLQSRNPSFPRRAMA